MYSRSFTRESGSSYFPALRLCGRVLLALLLLLTPVSGAQQQFVLSQPLISHWQYATEDTVNLTPATHTGHIYLPLVAGAVTAIRAADGGLLWKTEVGGELSAAPVADTRGVYIASESNYPTGPQSYVRATGALRLLGRTSGVTLWMRTLPSPIHGALVADAQTIFGGATDGHVYAIDKDTGEVKWATQYAAPFASQPVLNGGRLFLGSEDGSLLVLDQQTGRTLWRYQTRGAVRGPVALFDQLLCFGSADGYVYGLHATSGKLRWRTRTGAGVQVVAATQTPGGLLVASLDNFVYLLDFRRGARLWKRQLPGRIEAQPLIGTDSALFVPMAGDACVVLALRDGKQLNRLEVGEDNNTAASPVLLDNVLLLTTRHGLLAFGPPVRPE